MNKTIAMMALSKGAEDSNTHLLDFSHTHRITDLTSKSINHLNGSRLHNDLLSSYEIMSVQSK